MAEAFVAAQYLGQINTPIVPGQTFELVQSIRVKATQAAYPLNTVSTIRMSFRHSENETTPYFTLDNAGNGITTDLPNGSWTFIISPAQSSLLKGLKTVFADVEFEHSDGSVDVVARHNWIVNETYT